MATCQNCKFLLKCRSCRVDVNISAPCGALMAAHLHPNRLLRNLLYLLVLNTLASI